VSKLFGHGDLRLWLLKLLNERPRHGYDIIAGLEEQFYGVYAPSPGTVYPRLAALEQEGLIEVVDEEEGRKVYALTAAGKEELHGRADELRELGDRLQRSARDIAREIREDVKQSVRDIRQQIKEAARDVRRDERMATRSARETERTAREEARRLRDDARRASIEARNRYRSAREAARDVTGELRSVLRSLQGDLDGFVADIIDAARHRGLDADRLDHLKETIRDARDAIIDAVEGSVSGGDKVKDKNKDDKKDE
jgi:DNA-binding PadR family transcriptional regulator